MRLGDFESGGYDMVKSRRVVASAGREWRGTRHVGRPEKVVAPAGFEIRLSDPAGTTCLHAGALTGRHPPRCTPVALTRPLLRSLPLSFAVSLLQLKPLILKSYFFDSESIS
jgi:hypothetical protein